MESRLVPAAGYPIEYIKVGGLNRVGFSRQLKTALELPMSAGAVTALLGSYRPDAVFSMGGFVAGPTVIAALLRRIRIVVMEPNAIPGFTNRRVAPFVYRALVGFEETAKYFPPGRTEVTGLPVRKEFFEIEPKTSGEFTLLITGGSRGARTLNRASRESWPLFREHQTPLRLIHQTGAAEHASLAADFEQTGIHGEIVPFIHHMPSTFAQADLVLGRSGAGGVGEIAAAGMPSILVPLPTAADDHQRKNAEALVHAGAAEMVLDRELNGERLFRIVEALRNNPDRRAEMRAKVKRFAKPNAAERAAEVLIEAARKKTNETAHFGSVRD
jgi:UDP-N-acetylglucosamine--N-acetylmuramyl-(pentapeptide) pyrophosphoryl-undecaprenol N-acetylglucosamine transferase